MNIEELLHYNQLGFIPGPQEEEKSFLQRIHYCRSLDAELDQPSTHFDPSIELKSRLELEIGCSLSWVPIVYSNKGLLPWHGGCAWIFQKEAGGPKGVFFQLRKAFALKEKVFGYTKDEILMHEAIHAVRMEFEEMRFEEFLAYRSSKNSLRRFLGPIVAKPSDVILFFTSLILPFLLVPFTHFYLLMFLIPFGLLIAGFYRLLRGHALLERCYQNLLKLVTLERRANQILYRLTDKEIENFAKLPLDKLKAFIYSHQTESLRHLLIKAMTECKDMVCE
jgi:hypothetical protein